MKKEIYEKAKRISKLRPYIEKELGVKIKISGREIIIEGDAEKEYLAEQVLDAINLGFEYEVALFLTQEDFMLEIINIKDHTKRVDLKTIRSRIIGRSRKALDTLENLTKCNFSLYENQIGIIGPAETIHLGKEAIILLIKGTKHGNVYAHLEKNQYTPVIDLGLKKIKGKD